MHTDVMLENIGERLEKLNIYELRQVARVVGVHRPADGKKSRVIEEILKIASGETVPIEPSHRGAPPKSQQYDGQLVADITACRKAHLTHSFECPVEENRNVLKVSDSGGFSGTEVCGVIKFSEKRVSLHVNGIFDDKGITVHELFIKRYSLQEGDLIKGRCVKRDENEISALSEVYSVNGIDVNDRPVRRKFEELTHIYPQTTVKTEHGNESIACRIIDLFAPIALGQRGFITAPQKSEKTELIKQIATGISCNYSEIKTIVILIDELPEVINDLKKSLVNSSLFYTTFASSRESHTETVRLGFEYAKRQVEEGSDIIVLFDGITRLSPFLGNCAETEIRKLLFCACNAEEGGSLTVLSTLIQSADVYGYYAPFADTTVSLSAELAARRLASSIDIKNSFTDREDKLLSAEELKAVSQMRQMSAEDVLKLFCETSCNKELIKKFN